TPNQLVDFTQGEAVIKFDLSTELRSGRDWIDIRVSPYEDNLARTGDLFDQGPPRRSVNVFTSRGTLRAEVTRDFQTSDLPSTSAPDWARILTPSATRRHTIEIHLTRTHLKAGMPAYDTWWIDTDLADLGWSRGVVQFSQHSYSSGKECLEFNPDTRTWDYHPERDYCPNTWHWDNIGISPAIPFTIDRADRRVADAGSPAVTLAAPAPSGGNLRFAAIGANIQFSTDGGTTWQTAQKAAMKQNDPITWQSYWTPIPAGATSLRFRGQNDPTYGTAWAVEGISVFGVDGG